MVVVVMAAMAVVVSGSDDVSGHFRFRFADRHFALREAAQQESDGPV